MSERLNARREAEDLTTQPPGVSTRLPAGRKSGYITVAVADPCGGVPLDTILARIHALPSLPPSVLHILLLAGRECIAPREIAQSINRDFRFANRVLKAANASSYGLSREITSVSEMVLLLGSEAIRHIVLIASLHDILNRSAQGYGQEAGDLWAHSLACGMAAQFLAEQAGYREPQEAFVAGLLHDVGKVVLDADMQEAMPLVREHITGENCCFTDAERAILGFDHADIGGRIARHWNLPMTIVQAITLHHRPIQNKCVVPLAGLVYLADLISHTACGKADGEAAHSTLETQVMQDLKIEADKTEKVIARLVDCLAAAQPLLNLRVPAGLP